MDFLTIKNANIIRRVDPREILFITVEEDCLTFCLQNGRRFLCSKSLKRIEPVLPGYFTRVYRNCIVNLYKISEMNMKKRELTLLDGTKLPVSCRNIKAIAVRLSENPIRLSGKTGTFTEKIEQRAKQTG